MSVAANARLTEIIERLDAIRIQLPDIAHTLRIEHRFLESIEDKKESELQARYPVDPAPNLRDPVKREAYFERQISKMYREFFEKSPGQDEIKKRITAASISVLLWLEEIDRITQEGLKLVSPENAGAMDLLTRSHLTQARTLFGKKVPVDEESLAKQMKRGRAMLDTTRGKYCMFYPEAVELIQEGLADIEAFAAQRRQWSQGLSTESGPDTAASRPSQKLHHFKGRLGAVAETNPQKGKDPK